MVSHCGDDSQKLGKISLTQHGGVSSRLPIDSSAYSQRATTHNFVVRASWDDPKQAAARTAWHKETWTAFQPYSSGLYANLNAGDPSVRLRAAYGENLERLIEVKTKFDPKNLFHLNPNIVPKGA